MLHISFFCLNCFLLGRAYTFRHLLVHCIFLYWDDLTKNTKNAADTSLLSYLDNFSMMSSRDM